VFYPSIHLFDAIHGADIQQRRFNAMLVSKAGVEVGGGEAWKERIRKARASDLGVDDKHETVEPTITITEES
jgi:hypothetical protein